MALALFQKKAICEVVYLCLDIGDRVYHSKYGWGKIVEKQRTERIKQPRFWIETRNTIEVVQPWEISI